MDSTVNLGKQALATSRRNKALLGVSPGLRAKNRVVPVVGRVGLEPTTTEL